LVDGAAEAKIKLDFSAPADMVLALPEPTRLRA
jgi:hypothetical protein